MALIITPYVPTYITVHLGPPDSDGENITLPFADYIKNVASSEVYPTWSTSALRANILAQVSFALNRVYTEFYPSQGYDFQITSSTAYDQRFIKGRNIFDSINGLVDELFNDYIRRQGFVEPLAAQFCNGTTTQCEGLSQWGSEYMARNGSSSLEILRAYYGSNIELVVDAPIQEIRFSYPGAPMRPGDRSVSLRIAQIMLNRISQAYPAIPKVNPVDGIFGPNTEQAVRTFQSIFQLTPDGIIGKATWYTMVRLYTGILQLSELASQGQQMIRLEYRHLSEGTPVPQREQVALLQYLLSALAQFYLTIPFVAIDGIYGPDTRQAVTALQQNAGLPRTGVVDEATWDVIVTRFLSIDKTIFQTLGISPFSTSVSGELSAAYIQDALAARPDQFPGYPLEYGQSD